MLVYSQERVARAGEITMSKISMACASAAHYGITTNIVSECADSMSAQNWIIPAACTIHRINFSIRAHENLGNWQ